MKQFKQLFLLSLLALCFSGCSNSFMQGMAAGMSNFGNYGGYGTYGNGLNSGYVMPAATPVATGYSPSSYSGGFFIILFFLYFLKF